MTIPSRSGPVDRLRGALVWGALIAAMAVPVAVAATSPLLQWRSAVYIASGIAGALGLSLLLIQPLLAGGYLPGARPARMRRWHRLTGTALVALVAAHVGGLYLTSPPDVVDALLLASPTPFSVWGVAAMWALVLAALLAMLRGRLGLSPGAWRWLHNALALVVVGGTIVHALLIEGTMGWWSKLALCAAVGVAGLATVVHLRVVRPLRRRG